MYTKNKSLSQQGKNLGIRKKVNASHLNKESKYLCKLPFPRIECVQCITKVLQDGNLDCGQIKILETKQDVQTSVCLKFENGIYRVCKNL